MKKAFTMIELVMVIVVMGIVASIGADIIANLYNNYLKTRSINRLQAQTEAVLDQVAKRLKYRIKDSVIAKKVNAFVALPDATENHNIIEWIGKSNESFLGEHNGTRVVPGWSGFIDLHNFNETNSSAKTLKTNGSNLNYANNIISALSYGSVDLNKTSNKQRPAIIFKGKDSYNVSNYGWSGNGAVATDGNYTYKVVMSNTDTLEINGTTMPNTIYEQYDLAWSAYAIVPVSTGNDFNITLFYNYQPWENENYTDGNSSVLIEHASTFRFTQIGETIRIKLCINDDNRSGDYNFAFCKEKVVF